MEHVNRVDKGKPSQQPQVSQQLAAELPAQTQQLYSNIPIIQVEYISLYADCVHISFIFHNIYDLMQPTRNFYCHPVSHHNWSSEAANMFSACHSHTTYTSNCSFHTYMSKKESPNSELEFSRVYPQTEKLFLALSTHQKKTMSEKSYLASVDSTKSYADLNYIDLNAHQHIWKNIIDAHPFNQAVSLNTPEH